MHAPSPSKRLLLPLVLGVVAAACGTEERTEPTPDTGSIFDVAPPADTAPAPQDATGAAPDAAEPPDTAGPGPDAHTTDAVEPADAAEPTDTAAPPVSEVKFLVMGDTGTGGERQYAMGLTLATKCAELGCDFALLCGDNIYDVGVTGTMDPQWITKFEDPYAPVDFHFYPSLGNHDNGGLLSQYLGDLFGGAGGEFERGDYQVAYTQVSPSGKWRMPARTYDFEAGPAHFFALDTNDMVWSSVSDEAEARTQHQIDTFPVEIAQSTATWKFAFGHHPYISNGQHGDAGDYEGLEESISNLVAAIPFLGDLDRVVSGDDVKAGLDEIVCGNVDIYFAGHDHNRQVLPPIDDCGDTWFIVSGASSKTKGFRHQGNTTLFADGDTVGVFWVHAVGNVLTIKAIDVHGNEQWSTEIVK